MGNNCDTITKPTIRNLPSEGTGDIGRSYTDPILNINNFDFNRATNDTDELIYGFCAGTADTNVRRDYCSRVGDMEWEYKSASGSCHYSDCNKGYAQNTGCCNGCCGIIGKGVECRRSKFTGDTIRCCLNDFAGCGATVQPNDPRKYDLAFSNYEDGSIISQESTGGNKTDIERPDAGWRCSKSNCQRTCDPCLRSITSDGNTLVKNVSTNKLTRCQDFNRSSDFGGFCRENLMEYCSGGDLSDDDDSWIYRWMDNSGNYLRYGCLNVLARNVYGDSCEGAESYFASLGGTACTPVDVADYGVSFDGIRYASELMKRVSNKYAKNGYTIGSIPGTSGYNFFQDFMYSNICCKFPFLCQSFLSDSCSAYTADQLGNSISIANWCGCYLPDSEYQTYVNSYQINKECTPMCNRSTSIPLVTATNQPRYCSGTNCIIDNLAIQLGNIDVSGDINVTQICGNCSGGQGASCTCLISNNTVNLVGGDINNINTGETCTSTLCTAINPDTGYTETIPCEYVEDPYEYFNEQKELQRIQRQKEIRRRNLILLLIIFAVIIVIVILYMLLDPNLEDINIPKYAIRKKRVKSAESETTEGSEASEGSAKTEGSEATEGDYGNFESTEFQPGSVSII